MAVPLGGQNRDKRCAVEWRLRIIFILFNNPLIAISGSGFELWMYMLEILKGVNSVIRLMWVLMIK